jgi:glycosyltransferase involved in cell wall biosynthesis
LKIGLVCDWYHPRVGGIELHLQDLAARLVAAGHEVVVITPTPGERLVNGILVDRIDAPRAPRLEFLYTPRGVRAIGEALVRHRVDVLHCHVSIVSPAALGGAAQAIRRRMPTVLTFHSIVPQTRLLARAVRLAIGTGSWPARFTAVSDRVARDVRPIAGAREVSLLPNGIDVSAWRCVPISHDEKIVNLISVMRLNPKKRPLKLVDLIRALTARLPRDVNVRLTIAGDVPERGLVARAIARYGLDEHINLVGRKTRDEIRELLSASDVFVLPTVRESFGIAALEARCAGVPVVAMRASGVAELIEHGREGLLARSDVELVDCVAALIAQPERRHTMADYNRSTVPLHDWSRVVDAHLSVYREAIAFRDTALAEKNA